MSFTTGYNFTANTYGRATQVNSNFAFFRGSIIPVTQSGTWATTNGIYDLGSNIKRWANLYCNNIDSITIGQLIVTNTIAADNAVITNTISANHVFTKTIRVDTVTSAPIAKTLYQNQIIKGMARIDAAGTATMAITTDFGVSSISNPLAGMTRITWDNSYWAATEQLVFAEEASAARLNTTIWSITANTVDVEIHDNAGFATSGVLFVITVGEQ